ncbi:hypothetical protein [Fodinibius halophilus]|nr:hypothetical protein [Fodinibius halophilus]
MSCTNKEETIKNTQEKITDFLTTEGIDSDYILLVPNSGCPGCISTAGLFIKDHYQNKNLFVILTRISSVKTFEIRTGIQVDSTSNIIVDQQNHFLINGKNKIYPALFTWKNQRLEFKGYQKPKNDIFGYLQKKLQ